MINDLLDVELITYGGVTYSTRDVVEILTGDWLSTSKTVKSYMVKYYDHLREMSDDERRAWIVSKGRKPHNMKLGEYFHLVRKFKDEQRRGVVTVTVKLSRDEADRLLRVAGCNNVAAAISKAVKAYDVDYQFPCPVCGGPSMKDATVKPVKYKCFDNKCGNVWSKGESNRRERGVSDET